MEVRLFGELEVLQAGEARPVRGSKQRTLLAQLALLQGGPISPDRLIELLWGENPPSNPANALQAQIAQLRRTLGGDAIVTTDGGYALNVRPDDVDVGRFDRMVGDARTQADGGDILGAATMLRDALELRRSEPLLEFAYAEFAQTERTRLEELALTAMELRIEADLELGRHHDVVGELEALCREHPLRERLWELLMLALYRSGRQADALRAYSTARERLIEELGIEPGPRLRELESHILAQDASLAPPPPLMAPTPGNLRAPPTRFIGREAELTDLCAAVASSRLVTITGPGGVGKTRLALETAATLASGYRDGAWLVELAGVLESEGVAPAVASALRAGQPGGPGERASSTEDLVEQHVVQRSMLVVLDNCEQVIDAAARLAERLVANAPGLRVIATSREALNVSAERVFPISGLDAQSAAALFADRAQAAQPRFAIDPATGAIVDDICTRLDGLPLALELAAARLRALPLVTLAGRLDDRFRILTGRSRSALPRHQTLRAVVDWSYDLLFEDERLLFARMSVFAGGCELEAAEAVCADEHLPQRDVLDLLGRLIDKSLVISDVSAPIARYTQLQTLWDYGREKLDEFGSTEPLRQRHAHWYLDLARHARTQYRGPNGIEWRARIERDFENLRAALDWFVGHGDAASSLGLAESLAWLWFVRSDSAEGVRWLGDALAVHGGEGSEIHGLAMAWHALHLANVAGATKAVGEARGAVEELRRVPADGTSLAEALVLYSEILNRLGEFEAALAALAEARTFLDDADLAWERSVHDIMAAGNLSALGEFDEAERAARGAVERLRDLGERWIIIEGLGLLAGIEEARGRLDAAVAAYEELVDTARSVALSHYEALWLMRLAALRARLGDDAAAERLFGEAVAASRRPTYTGTALLGRAAACRRLGDFDTCRTWLEEAAQIHAAIDYDPGSTATFIGLAWWALAVGDLSEARSYAERACVWASKTNDPILAISAETASAVVELTDADTAANRARLAGLIEQRVTTGAARFARILGGAFGATLDEPDVAAVAHAHGLTD